MAMRKYSVPMALLAVSVFGALGSGCGPSTEGTCAEATYNDVGNLTAGAIGLTVDDLGIPIPGVRVYVPGTSLEIFSDANGRFSIDPTLLKGATSVQVWAEKAGYPDKVQEAEIPADRIVDLVLVMKPFTNSDTIDAATGGSVSDGVTTVSVDANSLAVDGTTTPVTGPVEVSIVTYRPQSPDDMKAAPGKLEGKGQVRDDNGDPVLDASGNPVYNVDPIATFGMADVSFYDQYGNRLELLPGKPAHVVMENIVEGDIDQDAVDQFYADHKAELGDYKPEPSIPLWHFNYGNGNWDRVEDENFSEEAGTEGGYLTLSADVPEFSPCNPDRPPVVCTRSIQIDLPVRSCVCKNVKNANDVENVRGSAITLLSRAREYVYLVVSCSNGSTSKTLVSSTMQTDFERTTTDDQGNFCGNAIVDPHSLKGNVRIDSTKTYWPGRLSEQDQQYKDTDGDGSVDDDGDGKVDSKDIIGYLGDTFVDVWNLDLDGAKTCGPPDGTLHVKCINQPIDPTTGNSPN